MNPFQLSFVERLREWNDLRASLKNQNLEQCCVAVDRWWQRAPLVNHHLHTHDTENWPDPWALLSENEYCQVARGAGILYTMYLLGFNECRLCEVTDEYGDEYIIVVCDRYIMNWHPNTTLCNKISDFNIKRDINISSLLLRIK